MMARAGVAGASWFQRFVLPGLAFKAVVIGGGYATGRELAEFFLASGPWGGLAAAVLAMGLWSLICAATFRLAVVSRAYDYRQFFMVLLGRWWFLFEIAYTLFIIVILAVYGAAAGAIGQALFGWLPLAGAMLLASAIALFACLGNRSVEALFKWVSILLYCVYAAFLVLTLARFGGAIGAHFGKLALPPHWWAGGIAYASYNVVGAVVILPVLRHLTSPRDALWAGVIAGPLAMAPAIAFFIAMTAFYPAIAAAPLPSEMVLRALNLPLFHLAFQLMIFLALLESGTGAVHAVNERLAAVWRLRRASDLPIKWRVAATVVILLACVFLADRIGLVSLIAGGYRLLAGVMLALFVAPLFARFIISNWHRTSWRRTARRGPGATA